MNTPHPADLSPLPYASGLAIGLLLILSLPGESNASGGRRQRVSAADSRLALADAPPAITLAVSLDHARVIAASS